MSFINRPITAFLASVLAFTAAFAPNASIRNGVKKESERPASQTEFYVAPDGDDKNDGTIEHPFATIEAARDAVREIPKTSAVTVYLREGDYYLEDGIKFDEQDSGSEEYPVTYAAYNCEKVRLIGAKKVDPQYITKAEDEISSRVIDKTAAQALMKIDLSFITPSILPVDYFGNSEKLDGIETQVCLGETPLVFSRYPNPHIGTKTYGYVGDVIIDNDDGSKTVSYRYAYMKDRVKMWADNVLEDLFLHGSFPYEWRPFDYKVLALDPENSTFTIKGDPQSYFSDLAPNNKFYFFNLPEEIDIPGESYSDFDQSTMYFYPDESFDVYNVYVAFLSVPMFSFNGTENFVIDGIEFTYTISDSVYGTGLHNFTVKNCTVSHTSSRAMNLNGKKITVSYCHIYDTANGGITISSPDARAELIPCESIVENCEIHSVNRSGKTYNAAVQSGGGCTGFVVRNNTIYDLIHMAIGIGGNDTVIENNLIYDCVKDSSDAGAIYFGRDPSHMGTVIRYNYFYNIGNIYGGTGQQSIYVDDGNSGADIYGNIFYKASTDTEAVKMHGAQFSYIHNNIFIDNPLAINNACWEWSDEYGEWIDVGGRSIRWQLWVHDKGGVMWPAFQHNIVKKITSANFDSELWREHYKGTIWEKLYDYINTESIERYSKVTDPDELYAMAYEDAPIGSNVVSGNVMVNSPMPKHDSPMIAYITYENNYDNADTSIFTDYSKQDFTLTPEGLAKIREYIPGFEELPSHFGVIEK